MEGMRNDGLVVVLSLCCSMSALAQGQVSLPAPLETGPTKEGLSPPTLDGASNCSKTEWRLALRGGRMGDVYEVYESVGNPVQVDPIGEFPVSPDLEGIYATKSANPKVGLTLVGYAHDVNPVPLARPIETTDLWIVVAIDTPGCNAQSATGFFVGR